MNCYLCTINPCRAMKASTLKLLLILLFLSAVSSHVMGGESRSASFSEGITFDANKAKVTFLDNLPDKEVRDFIQDSDGYLWIATKNGLYRYDGYHYKAFRSDLNHPNLISGNEIRAVAEDANKRIWFSTMAGLDRYDKRTGTLEHLTEIGSMTPKSVVTILTTRDGSVWLGGYEGMWQYRPTDQTYVCLTKPLSDRQPSVGVISLMEDSRGDIWIGTWDMGLFRYERSTGQIIEYPHINERLAVNALCEDDQHRIWVGSWQCGIQILENAWDPTRYQVTTIDKQHFGLAHDIIYTLCADPQAHAVYAGTPLGLTVFDTRQQPGKNLKPKNITGPTDLSYPGEQLQVFRKGRNGLFWAGMKGKGLCAIEPAGNMFDVERQYDVSRRNGTTACRSLLSDRRGLLFEGLGTTGFIVRDTTSGKFVSWKDMPEFARDETMSTVESIIESRRDGHIWMACLSMYILEYDPTAPVGRRATKYSAQDVPWLSNNWIYSMLEDHNGNLWFGGAANFSMRGADGTSMLLDTIVIDHQRTIRDVIIYDMDEDSDGNLWLATQRDGLIKVSHGEGVWSARMYNWNNGRLQSDNVQCVHADSKGRIWVGSASCGLHLYRPETDSFESLQKKWQIPGDAVNSIVEETASALWLGTNAGIVSLSLNSEATMAEVRRYQVEDGLQDNIFNRNAATRALDGRIYMGGNLGYNAFYPRNVVDHKNELRCNLTDILVGLDSWMTMEEKTKTEISTLAPEYTELLTLDYDQNILTFGFSSFDYVKQGRVRFQYRLHGLDPRPIVVEGPRHIAHYSNLTPGYYMLELGCPNSRDVRRVHIHIRPPFWLSWWAYLIYVALVLVGIFIFVRWMKMRMHRMQNLRMRVFERARREKQMEAERQATLIARMRHEMQQQLKQEQQTAADKTKLVFEAQEVEINSNDEDFVRKALDLINRNLSNANYDQQQFINDMGISKSTCFRKLKSLTGMGFVSLIRDVRMNAACRILEEKKGIRISELAYAVGYSDPRYFSTCFKKEYGMMPTEYAETCGNKASNN